MRSKPELKTRKAGQRRQPRQQRRRPPLRGWSRLACVLVGILGVSVPASGYIIHLSLTEQIEDLLSKGWTRSPATLYATDLELYQGQALDRDGLVSWLDELGYTRRDRAMTAGDFRVEANTVTLIESHGPSRGRAARISFERTNKAEASVSRIELLESGDTKNIALSAPLLSTIHSTERRKQRLSSLAEIPRIVVDAVLVSEDHRFFTHPGVDAIRIISAIVANLTGHRQYLVGASTITQQLIKNTVLHPEQTIWRKIREQALAILLERRLPKSQILELYLNEVYLGHQGSFAIHGVAQGARALFGKDLRNLTLGEAALMAGTIPAPQLYAPQRHPEKAQERRNVVLQAMVEHGLVTPDRALTAAREQIHSIGNSVDREAPYFVDLVDKQLEPTLTEFGISRNNLRVQTTLDLHLQRLAEAALRNGLAQVDAQRTIPREGSPQAALVAVDPRNGAIRALVGGRSYQESQFNRVDRALRQPGSIVKPFVYLAAFEHARREPLAEFTAASLIADIPTTFFFNKRPWRPSNYANHYDGSISARLALAHSRNVATVKVAEYASFEAIAELWADTTGGIQPPAYPSIALGVFESTPLQVATAYSALANGGVRVPLHTISKVEAGTRTITPLMNAPKRIASADSAFLVTSILRSSLESGTASTVRRLGFVPDAAGKTGTTDGLRDAWFAGFTPTLLTVVWVGMDDGGELGLTGAEAALPIWLTFMSSALRGQITPNFQPPPGIVFTEVDPESGLRAAPDCPNTIQEAFAIGTEPVKVCPIH